MVVIIGSMILVAMIGIYDRCAGSAAAVEEVLDASDLSYEILDRITEDLDDLIAPRRDVKVFVENKLDHGLPSARLTIEKSIVDDNNRQQKLERIIWQSSYDESIGAMVLYRSHGGLAAEDKLLDRAKPQWQRELFVPVCEGLTFFKLQVPRGERLYDRWTTSTLPNGVIVTISFAEPFKTTTGALDVPDHRKITRTVAVDRTRKIGFLYALPTDQNEPPAEPNLPQMPQQPQRPSAPLQRLRSR